MVEEVNRIQFGQTYWNITFYRIVRVLMNEYIVLETHETRPLEIFQYVLMSISRLRASAA